MNSLNQKVRVKLIRYGYCPESVDFEIVPWLNLRRLQSGRFKTNFDICKDRVLFNCGFRDPDFVEKLTDYIAVSVERCLVLKIVPFKKAS